MNILSITDPEFIPYGKALEARNRVITGDESALQVLEAICGKYPGHKELQMELAVSYMATARTGKCEEICRGVLESDPADFSANVLLSQSVASQGRYREASDLLTSLIKDPSVDTSVVGRLSAMRAEYNVQVIRDHEEAEAAGRKDDAELLDHAWRCLQNNMIEEADEIASKIDAGNVDGTELTDLMNQMATEFDTARRGELAIELQQAILDDNAYIFCSFLQMNMISKATVSNWTAHACDYYEVTVDLDIN